MLDAQTDEVMSQWGRLDPVVADLRDGRSGRLSIGYFASAGAAWMPSLVKRLTAEFPDLVLELVLNEVEQRVPALDIDLVIDPPDSALPGGYRRIELTEDQFVAIVPRGHPLAEAGSIALADLRGETWVSNDYPRSHGHRLVVAACSAAGFRPRFSVQAQDHYTAIGFVGGRHRGVGAARAGRAQPAGHRRAARPRGARPRCATWRPSCATWGRRTPPADRAVALLTELIAHPSGGTRRAAPSEAPPSRRSSAGTRILLRAGRTRASVSASGAGRRVRRSDLGWPRPARPPTRSTWQPARMPWARPPANPTPGARRA